MVQLFGLCVWGVLIDVWCIYVSYTTSMLYGISFMTKILASFSLFENTDKKDKKSMHIE